MPIITPAPMDTPSLALERPPPIPGSGAPPAPHPCLSSGFQHTHAVTSAHMGARGSHRGSPPLPDAMFGLRLRKRKPPLVTMATGACKMRSQSPTGEFSAKLVRPEFRDFLLYITEIHYRENDATQSGRDASARSNFMILFSEEKRDTSSFQRLICSLGATEIKGCHITASPESSFLSKSSTK